MHNEFCLTFAKNKIMGLDITTYKIVDHESDSYITVKLKYNFSEWTNKMSHKKIIEHLDCEKDRKKEFQKQIIDTFVNGESVTEFDC